MNYRALRLLLCGVLVRSGPNVFAQEGLWPEVPALLGGGPREIVAAIHQRLVYPPEARMACVTGRVFIAFDIMPAGSVQRVKVVKPLWASFDSAAVKAVRQLRFKPRQQQDADVHYVVPITYQVYEDVQAAKRALRHR